VGEALGDGRRRGDRVAALLEALSAGARRTTRAGVLPRVRSAHCRGPAGRVAGFDLITVDGQTVKVDRSA
jgi:hypothetical protein